MTNMIKEDGWNQESVGRLWEWISSNPKMMTNYFSYQVGRGIVNFLKDSGLLHGRVLDYGCGPGYLIEQFAKMGFETYGVDASDTSIARTNARLKEYGASGSAKKINSFDTPFPDGFFELITCVETLEHIPQKDVGILLQELRRLTKPGGVILISTPLEENLDDEITYCPFCDSAFHRWQHFRSYTPKTLSDLVSANGFNVIFSQGVDFSRFQEIPRLPNWRVINLDSIYMWVRYYYRRSLDFLFTPSPLKSRQFKGNLNSRLHKNVCLLATAND